MPSQTLRDLFAKRDEAFADFEYVAETYRTAEGEAPEDWTTEYEARKAALETLDERILEVEAAERRSAGIAEARKRAQIDAVETVEVRSEPRTYGEGSPNSWVADFVRGSNPMWPGHGDAVERLDTWAGEVAGEMRDPNSAEGKRARRMIAETRRDNNAEVVKTAVDRAASYVKAESRTGMTTGGSSGGSFVTPEYFVQDYAPYRQFGRVFADQANKQTLPPYGVTLYLPSVSGPAGVAAQGSENTAIQETDPTATYLSTTLTTNAGQVTVSQQLLDRAGPNFQFDKLVFDQLNRAYNLTLDSYVLTAALANAGSVAYTGANAAPTVAGIADRIAAAKAATQDTAGTVLPATHIFANVVPWEWMTVQADSSGRPFVLPDYAGPFNAFAAAASGAPNAAAEGDTGYKVLGLPVFEDNNIPQTSSQYQLIVAHMPEVWFWEGDLVPRVVPQTLAQDLSVLLQVYAYVGAIVRYPSAVQSITGTQMATSKYTFATA